ncbi:MAG: hypothetical protein QNK05_08015 [Myxococcota bacterium]|nr:hypothetical protein [Myxococcota bacterium]
MSAILKALERVQDERPENDGGLQPPEPPPPADVAAPDPASRLVWAGGFLVLVGIGLAAGVAIFEWRARVGGEVVASAAPSPPAPAARTRPLVPVPAETPLPTVDVARVDPPSSPAAERSASGAPTTPLLPIVEDPAISARREAKPSVAQVPETEQAAAAPAPVARQPDPRPAPIARRPAPAPIAEKPAPVAQKPAPKPPPAPVVKQPEPKPAPVARKPEPKPAPVATKPAPPPAPVAKQPEPKPAPIARKAEPDPVPVAKQAEPKPAPVARRPAPKPAPAKKPAPAAVPASIAESAPEFAVVRAAPELQIERTVWHPSPDRRSARVRVEGRDEPVELREGDAVGNVVVGEIQPSGVVFLQSGMEFRKAVGE